MIMTLSCMLYPYATHLESVHHFTYPIIARNDNHVISTIVLLFFKKIKQYFFLGEAENLLICPLVYMPCKPDPANIFV